MDKKRVKSKKVKPPEMTSLNFRIPVNLKKQLEYYCKQQEITMTEFIERAIKKYPRVIK